MDYQNLIKKLKVFDDFKQCVKNDKLSQAYLFCCPDKFTNKLLLLELAKLLLCKNLDACNVCEHCAKINVGTHPDVLIYPKDQNFIVDDANSIYDTVQVKPMLADKKIYLINNIDVSTEQSQNKLLKIIEEPPQNVVFLFSATNEDKVLPTILSRVHRYSVDKFNKQDILLLLNNVEEINKNIAINFGDGYLGKTLQLVTDEQFLQNYKNMQNLVSNLKKSEQIPYFSSYFLKDKLLFENNLLILNEFFRDILMLKIDQENLIKNSNLKTAFENLLPEFSVEALKQILNKLCLAKRKLDSNVNLAILADNLLLDILEVKYLCK